MPDPATDIFLGSFLSSLQKSSPTMTPPAQSGPMSSAQQVPDVLQRAGQQPAPQAAQQGPTPEQPQGAKSVQEATPPQIDPQIVQLAMALQAILSAGGGVQGVANQLGVPLAQSTYSPFPTAMGPQGLAQQSFGALPPELQIPEMQQLLMSVGYIPPAATGYVGQNPKMQQQYQFDQSTLGPALAALATLASTS